MAAGRLGSRRSRPVFLLLGSSVFLPHKRCRKHFPCRSPRRDPGACHFRRHSRRPAHTLRAHYGQGMLRLPRHYLAARAGRQSRMEEYCRGNRIPYFPHRRLDRKNFGGTPRSRTRFATVLRAAIRSVRQGATAPRADCDFHVSQWSRSYPSHPRGRMLSNTVESRICYGNNDRYGNNVRISQPQPGRVCPTPGNPAPGHPAPEDPAARGRPPFQRTPPDLDHANVPASQDRRRPEPGRSANRYLDARRGPSPKSLPNQRYRKDPDGLPHCAVLHHAPERCHSRAQPARGMFLPIPLRDRQRIGRFPLPDLEPQSSSESQSRLEIGASRSSWLNPNCSRSLGSAARAQPAPDSKIATPARSPTSAKKSSPKTKAFVILRDLGG